MYWKDLTKKDRKHLSSNGITTLKRFTYVAACQVRDRVRWPKDEPCWECRNIAQLFELPIFIDEKQEK